MTRKKYAQIIKIDDEISELEWFGEGSTCVCYRIKNGSYAGHKIKEFYPESINGENIDLPRRNFEVAKKNGALVQGQIIAYETRMQKFDDDFQKVNEISCNWRLNGGNMLEKPRKIVTSLGVSYDCGDLEGEVLSKYIEKNIWNNSSLDFTGKLKSALYILYYLCLDLRHYHPNHINLDIKPDNLLYIPINFSTDFSAVRNLDFSSCLDVERFVADSLESRKSAKEIADEFVFSTQRFYDRGDIEYAIKTSIMRKNNIELFRLDLKAAIKLFFIALLPELSIKSKISSVMLKSALTELFTKNHLWNGKYIFASFNVYSRLFSLITAVWSSGNKIGIDDVLNQVIEILAVVEDRIIVEHINCESQKKAIVFNNIYQTKGNLLHRTHKEYIFGEKNPSFAGLVDFYEAQISETITSNSPAILNKHLIEHQINFQITPNIVYQEDCFTGTNAFFSTYQIIKGLIKEKNSLIQGQASMGKSVLAHYLEACFLTDDIPAKLIECKEYKSQDLYTYPEGTVYIFDGYEELQCKDDEEEIIKLLQEGHSKILASRFNPVVKDEGNDRSSKESPKLFDSVQTFRLESLTEGQIRAALKIDDSVSIIPELLKTTMFIVMFLKMKSIKHINCFDLDKYSNEVIFISEYFECLEMEKKMTFTDAFHTFGEQFYSSLCGKKYDKKKIPPSLSTMLYYDNDGVLRSSQQKYHNYILACYLKKELLKNSTDISKLLSFEYEGLVGILIKVFSEALYYTGQMLKLEGNDGLQTIKKLDELKKDASPQFLSSIFIYCGYNDGCLDDGIFDLGQNFSKTAAKLHILQFNSCIKVINTKNFKTSKYIDVNDFETSCPIKLIVNKKRICSFSFKQIYCLADLCIGPKVRNIEPYAFFDSPNLHRITVSKNNKLLYSGENNCVVNKKTKKLILGCRSSIIPDDGSVVQIGEACFEGWNLKDKIIIVPSTVKKISSASIDMKYTGLNKSDICYGLQCSIRYFIDKAAIISYEIADEVEEKFMATQTERFITISDIKEYAEKNIGKKIIFKVYDYLNELYWDWSTATEPCRRDSIVGTLSTICLGGIIGGVVSSTVYALVSKSFDLETFLAILFFILVGTALTLTVRILVRQVIRAIDSLYLKQMRNCQKWLLTQKNQNVFFDIEM